MQLRFAIQADPGLGFDVDEIEAATTSKNAVTTFARVIGHNPRQADIIGLAHAQALKHSPSYMAHVPNAGLVIKDVKVLTSVAFVFSFVFLMSLNIAKLKY
jgi:hypothetical protein